MVRGSALDFTRLALAFALLWQGATLPALAQDDDPAEMEPGEYDEPPPEVPYEEPADEPVDEPMDEPPPPPPPPPMDEPMDEPPMDDPIDEPPPVDDHIDRDPPPPIDDGSGPRPDPNYGRDTGDSALVPVDPEKEKNRQVIRTVPRKEFTKAQVQAFCRQYNNQLISFYSDIYKVENCTRRRILNNKTVYSFMRDGKKITTVSQDVIAAIKEGTPLDQAIDQQSARGCKQLEGNYISYSNVDVYFVENCKKRLMPDWETYLAHREKHKKMKNAPIQSLSWVEFSALKEGKPIASVIDAAYDKLLDGSAGVDVIPVDEACRGLNGRVAAYYSRLYRIEKCRKREIIDPAQFFKTNNGSAKYVELSSEQWLSLPDGEPIKNGKGH